MPPLPLLVRVEPLAQTIKVIAERGDLTVLKLLLLCSFPLLLLVRSLLCLFHRSLLQRGVLVRVSLTPLSIRVEPLTQAVKVIAERNDRAALTLSLPCSLLLCRALL